MSNLIESIVTSIQNNITFALIAFSALIIIYTISLAVILKKIGHKALIAFIPIYNVMSLLTILNIPQWMVLLMFIPFINIVGFVFMTILIGYKLGTLCRKNILIKIGLMLLPPVFYPLLAFVEIDVDGSKSEIVVEPEIKKEFVLEPTDFGDNVEAPIALNLSETTNVDKITSKKISPIIEKIETKSIPNTVIDEHLAKANKDMPTAQDLTFDYSLLYNPNVTKQEIAEKTTEAKVDTPVETIVEESIISEEDEIVDTPIVPIIYDVVLESASPVELGDVEPIPINQRYENQMEANRRQKEVQIEKEKQKEEEIKKMLEPTVVLENGPVNLDSSLSSLMASAPDFNALTKKNDVEPNLTETLKMNDDYIPTTKIQEIVSMNIVEPSQLPVGMVPAKEDAKAQEKNEEQEIAIDSNNGLQQGASQLLRPMTSPNNGFALVDKVCPQCNAKMKRDCPVCIMCGHRF